MTSSRLPPSLQTLVAQAFGDIEPGSHDVIPAIHPSTTYERAPDLTLPGGRTYTRDENPNYELPQRVLAALEGGRQALLFSSGMAAAATVFDALPRGTPVVAQRQMYFALRGWLETLAAAREIDLSLIDAGDLDQLANALNPAEPALVWLETPANPTGEVTDLEAAIRIAHQAGARVAIDNTVPTPVLTRPLQLGADLVMHSATKQLNGHSDVLAGALVCADSGHEHWQRIRHERGIRGAIPGPFEAWLLLRGMRTLFLRVERSCLSALRVATALEGMPTVQRVHYPGLPSHPSHAIAQRQMQGGFGPLLSFEVEGGAPEAMAVAGRLRLFKRATSLGGVESLVEHRQSAEGPTTQAPPGLLRLSVGIEHVEDLVADLEQALSIPPA